MDVLYQGTTSVVSQNAVLMGLQPLVPFSRHLGRGLKPSYLLVLCGTTKVVP